MHRTKPPRILVLALLLVMTGCVSGSQAEQDVINADAGADAGPDAPGPEDAAADQAPDGGGPDADASGGSHFASTCVATMAYAELATERLFALDPPADPGLVLGTWEAIETTDGNDQPVTLDRPSWDFGAGPVPAIRLDSASGTYGTGAAQTIPTIDEAYFGLRIHLRLKVIRPTDGPFLGMTVLTDYTPANNGFAAALDLGVGTTGIIDLEIRDHPAFTQVQNIGSTIPNRWHEVMITTTSANTSICMDGVVKTLDVDLSLFDKIGWTAFAGPVSGTTEAGGYIQVDWFTVDRLFPPTPPPPPPTR